MFAEAPPVECEKLVKVSRTIADRSAALTAGLGGADTIEVAHLAEALQYRPRGLS